ncbi:hypothetical protein PHLGIDRAFT_71410 [Phlebiopsis gigantea 11061_1 CR5-6]|uniref:Aldehyde dehydrogenase n=1 Tax=Phlebiopsis gigantea (strain 11061_1 CR5-6) TaxID=745531 RepID=A0A0C3SAP3_PHLG1|nr:hypothetical protein PHLGIDRAFT_71410 [Phlebiopsis gigantea 11061_1 CR5-6]
MAPLAYTPVEDIPKIHAELRQAFRTGKTKSVAYRKEQLAQLAWGQKDNATRLGEALQQDLGRPPIESDLLDINPSIGEAKDAYDNVEKWARTEKTRFDFNWFASGPRIRKEPKGVVLIIAPFNFPILLLLGHLASAIAAGCCVLLKPSELCPATCQVVTDIVTQYLDPDMVRIVNGDVPVVTQLLELQWDHILYTGGGRVAKIISMAAAKFLTPVTLEVRFPHHRKSPVVIDPKTADLPLAARRILWGKIANAGQVCTAPDYVLIPREAQDAFVKELQEAYKSFYAEDVAKSDSYSRIVSQAHAARIKRYIDETKGKVVIGGAVDVETRFVAPTVVRDVSFDDSTMEDEIFGPLLPIIPVRDVDEAIELINSRETPLSLYVFTKDAAFKAKVFDNTQSGAAIANEVVIHVGTTGMPFGGVGPSGSGGYLTGKYGFETFTHLRGTLDNPKWCAVDTLVLKGRYPPYTVKNLRRMLKVSMPPRAGARAGGKRWGLWLVLALVGAVSAVLTRRRV